MAKKKSATSTKPRRAAPAPRPRARRAPPAPAVPDVEPEVLGAGDAHAAEYSPAAAPRPRGDEQLDPLFDYVAKRQGISEPSDRLQDAVIACYGGDWTPQRELALLKAIKADGRFVIEPSGKHKLVGIAGAEGDAAAGATPAAPPAEPPKGEPVKTLGALVAEQQGKPQRITWPHNVGSRVLLLTAGHPDRKARIRNIHNHDNYALYDLDTVNGGTCDGVPADRIGQDLDAGDEVERLRMRIGALERHASKGATLAQRHVAMAAEQKSLAEGLKEHRAAMDKLAHELADHARSDIGQTDLRDLVGNGDAPAAAAEPKKKRGEKMAAKPSAAEDKLADTPPATPKAETAPVVDGIYLDAVGLSIDALLAARLDRSTASTGKPQVVKPLEPLAGEHECGLGSHLVVDVQAGVAVLLPVLTKKDWTAKMAKQFGQPMDLPSSKQPAKLAKGGALCGMPVKVGRAVCYLGADAQALLVRMPAAEPTGAEPARATGKDAAAGG